MGGAIHVAIYDDRMEIISPGSLPPGVAIEDLKRDHRSVLRNPTIAEAFFRAGLIERWGRGTQKIVEMCLDGGYPEPDFLEQSGGVIVRFPVSGYVPPTYAGRNLSERQQEVLRILGDREPHTFREIHVALAHPPAERTLRDDMKLLRDLGLIDCSGRGPNARWRLVPSSLSATSVGSAGSLRSGFASSRT